MYTSDMISTRCMGVLHHPSSVTKFIVTASHTAHVLLHVCKFSTIYLFLFMIFTNSAQSPPVPMHPRETGSDVTNMSHRYILNTTSVWFDRGMSIRMNTGVNYGSQNARLRATKKKKTMEQQEKETNEKVYIMRAIGVSHTACKHEFRRNLRSHSWSVFPFYIIYIGRKKQDDTRTMQTKYNG